MAVGTLKSETPRCLDEGVARTSEATPGTIGCGPGERKCPQTIRVAQVATCRKSAPNRDRSISTRQTAEQGAAKHALPLQSPTFRANLRALGCRRCRVMAQLFTDTRCLA
jgi:hypothetical protein